jgi:hypothetical protein
MAEEILLALILGTEVGRGIDFHPADGIDRERLGFNSRRRHGGKDEHASCLDYDLLQMPGVPG